MFFVIFSLFAGGGRFGYADTNTSSLNLNGTDELLGGAEGEEGYLERQEEYLLATFYQTNFTLLTSLVLACSLCFLLIMYWQCKPDNSIKDLKVETTKDILPEKQKRLPEVWVI